MGKFCSLCQVTVQDEKGWNFHIYGKKHKSAVRNQQYREYLQQRTLFVSGFEKGTSQLQIAECFMKYGWIEKVNISQNSGFAFVEFRDPVVISQILSQRHFLGKKRLLVKPRRTNPQKERRSADTNSVMPVQDLAQNEMQHENLLCCLKISTSVNHQMDLVQQCLQMTEEERKARFFVCRDLAFYLQQFFETFELNLFGSSMTHLGFHNCDIDMVLTLFPDGMKPVVGTVTDKPRPNVLKTIVHENLRKIRLDDLRLATMANILACTRMLLQRNKKYQNVLTIPAKSAPLIRFTVAGNLTCDLSIKNKIAVYNTKLIKFYLDFDQRVLPLILSIKYWIKCHDLGGSGNQRLTSYAVTMMVIFFLQNTEPPVLPTVEMLQNSRILQPVVLDGWQCSFSDDIYYCSENQQRRVDLLKSFYDFYHSYDFSEYVISPYNGKSILRMHVVNHFPEFKLSSISVQDPFELNRNITGNVTDRMSANIILSIQQTKVLLSSETFESGDKTGHWGLAQIFDKNAVKNITVVPALKLSAENTSEKVSFSITFNHGSILQPNPNSLEGQSIIEKMYAAVILTLTKGLQFECIRLEDESLSQTDGNSRKRKFEGSEPVSSKKFITKEGPQEAKETNTASDNGNADLDVDKSKSESQKYLCTIRYRTWIRRKKMRQTLSSQLSLHVIPAEEKISQHLIEDEKNRSNAPAPCSSSFVCRLSPGSQQKQSAININLTPLDNSAELKSVLFEFLPSYLPKIVDRYLLEGDVTL